MPQADNFRITSRANAQPIPKQGRGVSRFRRPALTMADDPVFKHATIRDDDDMEDHTWPDFIDQTRIHEAARGPWANDDLEIDDGV